MFQHYIAILGERSQCLLRDAQLSSSQENIVDGRDVSIDVVRICTMSQYFIDLSSIEHLSEGTRNAP
jgi:hypothetical protein